MAKNMIGTRLGKYEIQAEIGKGGMGVVYLGYDPMLDRQVAVKVLAPHLVWEPGFVERFLREARAAARLKHASLVTIYDVGQEGDWYYFVMEYLEGQTVSQIIRQKGALTNEQVLYVLRRLADALDYAHSCGLVHRDVKPANIIVSPAGQVTLTDFGVARAAQETRLTSTGSLLGTPQYMSPEQAQGEVVGHHTDIYSLGVVAYEMLTGRAPFGATTPHAVLHQLIYDPPPPVCSRRPDLPAAVDQVMAKVLAKKPDGRHGTAREFVGALEPALTAERRPVSTEPEMAATMMAAGPPAPSQVRSPAPVRRARPEPIQEARSAPAATRDAAPAAVPRTGQGKWTLWLGWLLTSTIGGVVGWAIGAPLSDVVTRSLYAGMGWEAAEIVGLAVAFGMVGLVTGVTQWLILRRWIGKAAWWVLATTAGWTVIGMSKWGLSQVTEEFVFETMFWLEDLRLPMLFGMTMGITQEGLTGLVVGVAQWLVLQRQVKRAGWWVIVSTLAWVIGGAAFGIMGRALGEAMDEIGLFIPSFVVIIPSAVTASGLVWLLFRNGKGSSVQP